jgi:hypothetical protein
MVRVVEYYTRFQGARSRLTGLPPWARFLLLLASLPGVLLISLSILAFGVSLLALLLLTVPLYRLLRLITGSDRESGEAGGVQVVEYGPTRTKRVESTVTDAPAADQGL